MTLTEPQKKWVTEFTGVQIKETDWKESSAEKALVLQDVNKELAIQKRELQELLKFTLAKKDGGRMSSSLGDTSGKWMVDDEIDSVHDTKNLTESLPKDIEKRAMRAIDLLNGLSARLEKGGFTDKEIRIEFWDPLKREGICPDNFIPDRFNETVQVFRESDKYYQARQQQDGEKYTPKISKDIKFGINKSMTIVSSLNKVCGGPDLLGTIADATKTIGQATVTIYEGVVAKDAATVADSLGDIVGASIKAGGVRDDEIAVLFQKSFSLAIDSVKFGKACADGKPEEAFRLVGEAAAHSFALFDGGDVKASHWAKIGKIVSTGIQSAVDIGAAGKAIKEQDWAGLTDVAQLAIARGISSGLDFSGAIEKKAEEKAEKSTEKWAKKSEKEGHPKTEKEIKEKLEVTTALNTEDIETSIEKTVGEKGSLGTAFENLKKAGGLEELKKELDEKEAKKLRDELEAALSEDNRDFENELNQALQMASMDPSDLEAMGTKEQQKAENSIEKMIQKIEKVRATLKILEAVFDTGMKTAAEFVEPLKIATAGKDFLKNAALAIKQAVELNQWIDEVERAAMAASVYGRTFANRVKNLRVQISEKTAHAVCDMLQIIGGGLACGVVTAPVGIIVGKIGTAAQATSDAAFELGKRLDARDQWNKYRECLDLPPHMTDRKLMRESLRGNPTLAKYAMAYGAVIERDPIAVSGMKLCGISESNLEEEGTNVKLVVKYLEKKFDEDPILVRQVPEQSWQSKSTDISLSVFKEDLKKATDATGFINEKTGAIEGGFGQYAALKPKYDTAQKDFQKQQTEYLSQLQIYEMKLSQYAVVIDEYDLMEKRFDDALNSYREFEKQEETKKEEPTFKSDYYKAMDVLFGYIAPLNEKIERCTEETTFVNDAAEIYFGHAQSQLDKIAPYLEAKEAFAMALRRFGKDLRKFAPKKKGEDESPVADESVQQYINGLAQRVIRTADEVSNTDPTLAADKRSLEQLIAGRATQANERQSKLKELNRLADELTVLNDELIKKLPVWKQK